MGEFVAGQFFLKVSFRYPTEPGEFDVWGDVFEEVSRILQGATLGAHSLARPFFSDNSMGGRSADIWILDVTPNDSTDQRIWLPGTHMRFTRQEASIPGRLAHELCHYLYDLGDEYLGPDNMCQVDRQNRDPDFCLMEAFDANLYTRWRPRVVPRLPLDEGFYANWRDFFADYQLGNAEIVRGTPTKFCDPRNHNPVPDTPHNIRSDRQSCWEYIVNDARPYNKHPYNYGLVMPGGPP